MSLHRHASDLADRFSRRMGELLGDQRSGDQPQRQDDEEHPLRMTNERGADNHATPWFAGDLRYFQGGRPAKAPRRGFAMKRVIEQRKGEGEL